MIVWLHLHIGKLPLNIYGSNLIEAAKCATINHSLAIPSERGFDET